jgi:hypothetical protein
MTSAVEDWIGDKEQQDDGHAGVGEITVVRTKSSASST